MVRTTSCGLDAIRGWDTSARANVSTTFPLVENGWTHCDQIWCVVIRDRLATLFTSITEWSTYARVHRFDISVTAGDFVLKLGTLLETH